jgi:hypothetical protein
MTHPARLGDRRWFPSWPRIVDDGRGLTENFCTTLLRASREGTKWTVLAQDDVEPCAGLEDGLDALLATAPTPVVAAFSLAPKRDAVFLARGQRWRMRRRGELLWVMLLAVRTSLVSGLVAGVRSMPRPADARGAKHAKAGCDERLSRWLDSNDVAAATHLPNLVQHRGDISLVGHGWTIGGRPRISPTFIDGATMTELCDGSHE